MKFHRKVSSKFETDLKDLSVTQLEELLKKYQDDLDSLKKGPIHETISKYDEYKNIDANIRDEYETLVKKLGLAKIQADYYKGVNPTLQELYMWGECQYYFNGSVEEINESQKLVETLESQIKVMEEKYPALNYRRNNAVVIPATITSVCAKLVERINLIKREVEAKKVKSK